MDQNFARKIAQTGKQAAWIEDDREVLLPVETLRMFTEAAGKSAGDEPLKVVAVDLLGQGLSQFAAFDQLVDLLIQILPAGFLRIVIILQDQVGGRPDFRR